MTAVQTNNQRKHERMYLSIDVPVIDVLQEEEIGNVVNLTVEGMMLALRQPRQPGAIYQLALLLPEDLDNGADTIKIGADCLWCSDTSAGGRYWAGLQIVDASSDTERLIAKLIESYGA